MNKEEKSSPGLGRQVSTGSVWMLLNTLISKALSLIAQFAMGWFLSDRDFGVYAIAISVSTVASLLRDGGLSRLLVTRGNEYQLLQGPVFWMMLTFNSAAALVLVAVAPVAAKFYVAPQLQYLLLLVALSLPLLAPGAVLSAKLSVDLRYREMGAIQACSSVLRYGGMVAFGCFGFGAASFLLPVLLVALFEWLAYWRAAKSSPWRHPARLRTWPGLFEQTKWILLGTFAIGFMNYGAYFLIGKLVQRETVGVYFFAFQMVLQVGILLSNNLYQVLFPAFARIADDIERCRAALLRSIDIVALATTWLSVILVPLFSPIENLIWHGKWAASNASVQILSLCYPASAMLSSVMAVQSARGEFRQWGLMTLGLSVGSVLAASAGAYWGHTSDAIALCSGMFTMLGAFGYSLVALRPFRIGALSLMKCLLPAWLVGLAAALASLLVEDLASRAGWVAWKYYAIYPAPFHAFVQIALITLFFSLFYFFGIRLVRPVYLRQTIELLPKSFGSHVSRLLLLSCHEAPAVPNRL
jgi:O-antigen/teichoic acid export membrane protein